MPISNHIAELGQQIQRSWGDKVWVCNILGWLIQRNPANEQVIRYIMTEYNRDMRLYRVRLTYPCTGPRLDMARHLRVCLFDDFEELVTIKMKRVVGCIVDGVVDLDALSEDYVEKKVKIWDDDNELRGRNMDAGDMNGEIVFCRVKMVDVKKRKSATKKRGVRKIMNYK